MLKVQNNKWAWLKREIKFPQMLINIFGAIMLLFLASIVVGLDLLWVIFLLHGRWEYTPVEPFIWGLIAIPILLSITWLPVRHYKYRHFIRAGIVTVCIGQFMIGPEGSLIPLYQGLLFAFGYPAILGLIFLSPLGLILPFVAGLILSIAIEKALHLPGRQ